MQINPKAGSLFHANSQPWLQRLLARKPPKVVAVALANKIARIAWRLMTVGQRYDGALTARIIIAADQIAIHLNRTKIAAWLQARVQGNPHLDLVVLSIEAKLRRAGKEKRLIIANGANSEINQGLVELIKEAFAHPEPAPLGIGR
jgi:hypothetical protein